MASVGHIAVGLAGARAYQNGRPPPWPSMTAWSALSLLPDVDSIGFALGVPYEAVWGHRGATHSLTFAVALALAIGLAARWFRRPFGRTALFATLVLASHAILDTMTDGGLGCALLWPFDSGRYFAPWRPIPVAPIGLAFVSPSGAIIASMELMLFSPLLLFALRPSEAEAKRVPAGAFTILWMTSAWLIASRDPLREATVGLVLGEDTAYTTGYSERAFRTIAAGHSDDDVRRALGTPFAEAWIYFYSDEPVPSRSERSSSSLPAACVAINFENGRVVSALEGDACRKRSIQEGMSRADAERLLGSPAESCWRYSWSPANTHYRMRMVCFSNGRVDTIVRRWE